MKKSFVLSTVLALFASVVFPFSALAYSDTPKEHPYYSAIMDLSEKSIVKGYEDGTFRPDNTINRAELIKMLFEGLGQKPDPSEYVHCFPDVKAEWFAKYVCYAQKQHWVEGYPDGNFYPGKEVNRAEALKIILNAFEMIVKPVEENPFADVDKNLWFAPFVALAKEKNLIPEVGDAFSGDAKRTRGEIAEIFSRILKIKELEQEKFQDWPAEWASAEMETLALMNKIREENGRPPLNLNPYLSQVAREHAKDMAENLGQISHLGSDGSSANDRITNSGYDFFGATAENVGSGMISSGGIIKVIEDIHRNIYLNEPNEGFNHKTTLLGTSYDFSEVGIGIYVKDGKVYFTVDFVANLKP